jgi:hypothetical protein
MAASGSGFWECDLLNGAAWFSDWFRERLPWPEAGKRQTLHDLRLAMQPETWELLLRTLRAHFEQGTPLDIRFQVQVTDGHTQQWRMRGSAQLNEFRHPTHFAGTMCDVSAERAQHP